MEAALSRIYYGSSIGAYRGPAALLAQAKAEGVEGVNLAKVKQFLAGQPAYTLYRPARKNYPRRKIIAHWAGEVFQIDIMVMQRFNSENDYSYVLLGYDSYTRYVLAVPLKTRKPGDVQDALEMMISEAPFRITSILWDREGSFLSRKVQSFLKQAGVHNYTTTSKVKAPGVERLIRTIRTAVQRHFEWTKSQRWQDFLPTFIHSYNQRIRSRSLPLPRQSHRALSSTQIRTVCSTNT